MTMSLTLVLSASSACNFQVKFVVKTKKIIYSKNINQQIAQLGPMKFECICITKVAPSIA